MPRRKSAEKPIKVEVELPTFSVAEESRMEYVESTLNYYKEQEASYGLTVSSIATLLFKPLDCFKAYKKRTPNDIKDTLSLFQLITLKINEVMTYVPMKTDFCRLLGISMGEFSRLKNADSSEYEDAIYMVEDFIGGFIMQGAMTGQLKEISSVYTTKATLGWKDAPDTIVQNNIVIPERKSEDIMNEYLSRIPTNKDTGKITKNSDID